MFTDDDRYQVRRTLEYHLPLTNVIIAPPMRVGILLGSERRATIEKEICSDVLLYNSNKQTHMEILCSELVRLTNLHPRYQEILEAYRQPLDWRPTETMPEDYYAS